MNIYPAIDIYQGKVVRLLQGDYAKVTAYPDDPAQTAKIWEAEGAQWIHIVDLDGAKTGRLTNQTSIEKIRRAVKTKIQVGGGVRDMATIQKLLDLGIDRVVIGTKAVERPFLEQVAPKFGEKLAVGLDVKDGMVRTGGWLNQSEFMAEEALRLFEMLGVKVVIYTDIEKDGMLSGPNMEKLEGILEQTSTNIILSGGIGRLADLEKCQALRQQNFEGVIIGKALYDKKFTLTEAFQTISPA